MPLPTTAAREEEGEEEPQAKRIRLEHVCAPVESHLLGNQATPVAGQDGGFKKPEKSAALGECGNTANGRTARQIRVYDVCEVFSPPQTTRQHGSTR